MRLYELFEENKINNLFELFQDDFNADLQVIDNTPDAYLLTFSTHELKYVVSFGLNTEFDLDGGVWYMDFSLAKQNGKDIPNDINPYKNTNTGHAFLVYASVWSAVKQFISDKNPAVIEFDADDPQRVKIYDLLIKKLKTSAKQLGYVPSKIYNTKKQASFEIARADMTWGNDVNEETNILRLNPYDTEKKHAVYTNPSYSEIKDAYDSGITDFRFIIDNSNSLHVINALELTHNNLNRKFPHDKTNTGQILIYPKLIHIFARSKSAAEKMSTVFKNCNKRVKVDWDEAEEEYNQINETSINDQIPNLIAKSWKVKHRSSNIDSLKNGFKLRPLGISFARNGRETPYSSPTVGDANGRPGMIEAVVRGKGLDYSAASHKNFIESLWNDNTKDIDVINKLRDLGVDWVSGWNGIGCSDELHVLNSNVIKITSIKPILKTIWDDEQDKLIDVYECVGKIVKGVNTTCDVDVGETKRQAAKFGFDVTEDGYPPLIYNRNKSSKA